MQKKLSKNAPPKKARLSPEARARRMQQIFFAILVVVMIVAMLSFALFTNR